MAYIAPMDKAAATVDVQADPDVIVVTQNVLSPIGTPIVDDGGDAGTRAFGFVA